MYQIHDCTERAFPFTGYQQFYIPSQDTNNFLYKDITEKCHDPIMKNKF